VTPEGLSSLIEQAAERVAQLGAPDRGLHLFQLAALLNARGQLTANVADLDRAALCCREAAALVYPGDSLQVTIAVELGAVLAARFGLLGQRADLDAAITTTRMAVAIGDGDARALAVSNLGNALWNRYQYAGGDSADLDEAVELGREAIAAIAPEHPMFVTSRAAFTGALVARGRLEDLDEAIAHSAVPHMLVLVNRSAALLNRFRRTGNRPDLDEAVIVTRQAARQASPDDPVRPVILGSLGVALMQRFGLTEDIKDLEEAEAAAREGVTLVPERNPQRALLLRNLTAITATKAAHTNHRQDLNEAVRLGRIAADGRDPFALAALGHALVLRAMQTNELDDLKEAVGLLDEALARIDPSHPERHSVATMAELAHNAMPKPTPLEPSTEHANPAMYLLNKFIEHGDKADLYAAVEAARQEDLRTQSWILQASFDHTGNTEHLEQAVTTARAAGSPLHLGGALRLRFAVTGDPTDIDEAVQCARNAAKAAQPPDNIALHQTMLSQTLRARLAFRPTRADADEMVEAARAAVANCTTTDRAAAGYLHNLAVALRDRFEHTGDLAELDEAIRLAHQGIDRTPPGHALRTGRLADLGAIYFTRYRHLGKREDLDSAIQYTRSGSPSPPNDSSTRLANLAVALRLRFHLTNDEADINEAVEAARQALAQQRIPVTSYRALGTALVSRFELRHDRVDIDEAISILREVRGRVSPADAEHKLVLDNLALALLARLDQSDIEEAVAAYQEATATLDYPSTIALLSSYGLASAMLYDHNGTLPSPAEINRVITALGEPTATSAVNLVEAGHFWGLLAAESGDMHQAMNAYAAAVRSLPMLASRGLGRQEREQRLVGLADLTTDAAAYAIEAGQPEQAVELLEQGRSVLWNQILQSQVDLESLRAAAPELAARLDDTRHRLNRTDVPEGRRKLAGQWENLLDEARRLPGFEAFLRPVPFSQLKTAASEGPVVIVNVADHRADALVVRPSGVEVIALPGVRRQTVAAELVINERTDIPRVLAWLWEKIAAPVLDAIAPIPQRIWWCPTGILSVYPLHAACIPGVSALDRVVSSYTPTLTALLRARQKPQDPSHIRLAAVLQPNTPGHAPLPNVDYEVARLSQWATVTTTLHGPSATRAEVLDALARHQWAHLACHGGESLALHDGPLTVMDLAAQHFTNAEFAFLSACTTAIGGAHLPDEAINIATGFHLAGYRNVVGTLWRIRDDLAPEVTEQFYRNVTTKSAAEALHQAVNAIRSAHPDLPEAWAPYVHIGP
jgi:tetratricopeptide (TPR) repeat protein